MRGILQCHFLKSGIPVVQVSPYICTSCGVQRPAGQTMVTWLPLDEISRSNYLVLLTSVTFVNVKSPNIELSKKLPPARRRVTAFFLTNCLSSLPAFLVPSELSLAFRACLQAGFFDSGMEKSVVSVEEDEFLLDLGGHTDSLT